MPIDPTPEMIPGMMPTNINVPLPPGATVWLTVSVGANLMGGTEETMDAFVQGLVDYFQAWEGRHPQADVTAAKYEVALYRVGPTNPIPPSDPPLPEPS